MDEAQELARPPRRPRFRLRAPRFSLRALLVAVLLIAVAIPVGQCAWRRYVIYRDAQRYAALRAARTWNTGGSGSSAIDDSRGVPDDYIILVRTGNTFGCFIPRKQNQRGESTEYDWY